MERADGMASGKVPRSTLYIADSRYGDPSYYQVCYYDRLEYDFGFFSLAFCLVSLFLSFFFPRRRYAGLPLRVTSPVHQSSVPRQHVRVYTRMLFFLQTF